MSEILSSGEIRELKYNKDKPLGFEISQTTLQSVRRCLRNPVSVQGPYMSRALPHMERLLRQLPISTAREGTIGVVLSDNEVEFVTSIIMVQKYPETEVGNIEKSFDTQAIWDLNISEIQAGGVVLERFKKFLGNHSLPNK